MPAKCRGAAMSDTVGVRGFHRVESFSRFPVVAAFSDRTFDMRYAEDLAAEKSDRRLFCERLGLPAENLVCLEQIHSAHVVCVSLKMKGKGAVRKRDAVPRTDGAVTREKRLPVGVLTADCAPVFLFDSKTGTAGIAHIGWRGLQAGMAASMMSAFYREFLSCPEDLHLALGPAIRQCCYQVGGEVSSLFRGFSAHRNGKIYLDLAAAILAAFRDGGVPGNQMEDMALCTSCNPGFFYSYRRDGKDTGRMLSVIMLR